jgi:steroid delta-isomerase-like uncharacterized protein
MSVEENLRLLRDSSEAWEASDWDRHSEHFAESIVYHGPQSPEPLEGLAALREMTEEFWAAFPDLRYNSDSFGQGDWVCQEWTITGTHTGPFEGVGGETIPATNKPLRMQGCTLYKFEGGEVTEIRSYSDLLEMMTQLGLAP